MSKGFCNFLFITNKIKDHGFKVFGWVGCFE